MRIFLKHSVLKGIHRGFFCFIFVFKKDVKMPNKGKDCGHTRHSIETLSVLLLNNLNNALTFYTIDINIITYY